MEQFEQEGEADGPQSQGGLLHKAAGSKKVKGRVPELQESACTASGIPSQVEERNDFRIQSNRQRWRFGSLLSLSTRGSQVDEQNNLDSESSKQNLRFGSLASFTGGGQVEERNHPGRHSSKTVTTSCSGLHQNLATLAQSSQVKEQDHLGRESSKIAATSCSGLHQNLATLAQRSQVKEQDHLGTESAATNFSCLDRTGDGFIDNVSHRYSEDVKVKIHAGRSTRIQSARAVLQRLHTLAINEIRLLRWEWDELIRKDHFGIRAVQYMCWRRSLLETAFLFYSLAFLFSLAGQVETLFYKAPSSEGHALGFYMGEYAKYFLGVERYERFYHGAISLGMIPGSICCLMASKAWKCIPRSSSYCGISFFLGYAVPFVLFLLLPFRHGVDLPGLQKNLCVDLLNGRNLSNVTARLSQIGSGMRGDFASMLDGVKSRLEVWSDASICSESPATWTSLIIEKMDEQGRVRPSQGELCPAARLDSQHLGTADTWHGSLMATEGSVEAAAAMCATPECQVCSTTQCLLLLPMLRKAAVSVQADAFLGIDSGIQGGALQELLLDSASKSCGHCVVKAAASVSAALPAGESKDISCAALCLPYWAANETASHNNSGLSKQLVQVADMYRRVDAMAVASLAEISASRGDIICMGEAEVMAVKVLGFIATSEETWRLLLGLRSGCMALATLVPATFAIMLGSFKAACVARAVVPYSRVPGFILGCAVIFTLPFLFVEVIVLRSLLGNWIFIIALSCFVGASMVYFPFELFFPIPRGGFNLIAPSSVAESNRAVKLRSNLALALNFAFVLFIIVWFFSQDSVSQMKHLGLIPFDNAFKVFEYLSQGWVWSWVILTVIKGLCSLYGVSKISTVFFSDLALYMLLEIDEADVCTEDDLFREIKGEREKALYREMNEAWRHGNFARKVSAVRHSFCSYFSCCSRRSAKNSRPSVSTETSVQRPSAKE